MSINVVSNDEQTHRPATSTLDMRLEVVLLPVSDVDRTRNFYERLGWRFDGEFVGSDGSRSIQFTPPGSWCSVQFGTNVTPAPPGSAQGLHLIVSDIEAAREELIARGVDASEIFHCSSGYGCRFPGNDGRVNGPHPKRGSYASFISFSDPDGNGWLVQEVTARFPGRVAGNTTFASTADLSNAMQRAAAAHGQHEARLGQSHPNWPDWYAEYMVREQAGAELPD
ncbi:MAG TPA: VOC family protein [Bryobacteraceae bacterium]|nr:VOC family protein [Bryobacteraceae bacterium]